MTFSKPIHVVLIVPLVLWAALGRRWRHGLVVAVVFLTVAGGLFAVNAAVTGEFNYQGGDRNTFYSSGGFPFQTDDLRYRSGEQRHSTNAVPFDSLVNRDALLTVFPHNLVYFLLGRHSGLAPYFFPAVVSSVLFLLARRTRERWQWLVAATILLAVVALLLYMPFTYSGGGGSLGNRYLLGFYPLFLFLTPPLKSAASAVTATVVGSVFTAQLIANPFYSSFYPAELPTRWPFRLLPIELSLLNDLPVDLTSARIKQPLGGRPPLLGYFLDSNAFLPAEDGAFWVRGESRTQIILRVPARELSNGSWEPLRVRWLRIELRMGDVENDVEASVGRSSRTVTAAAHATVVVTLDPGRGFPFRPMAERPTNELYVLTLSSRTGFVPMFTSGGADHRFLGVQVRVEPVYKP